MAKTSALTGSQKKTQRAGLRTQRDILKGKHAPTLRLQDLLKDFARAGAGAEKLYAPVKEQALQEFGQSTLPGVLSEFGDAGLGRSSALNQALAAAKTNLARQLASDFAGFQTNLASGLLNQREQSKMGYLGQLGGLASQGAFANPYQQKQGGGPSALSSLIGAGIQAGGTALGGFLGGPPGAVAGGAAASGLNKAVLPGMNQL